MTENNEYPIKETLEDLQSSIKRKLYALELLDFEYSKICLKLETNSKSIDELTSKMYNLESNLKSIECRVEEYEKKEKNWEREVKALKNSVEEIQMKLEEEKYMAVADDIQFDETVLKLVDEFRKDRDFFDSSATGEQIETLQDTYNSTKHESSEIKKALMDLRKKHQFLPSKEVEFILKNSNLSDFIVPEIQYLQKIKATKIDELNKMKETILSLETEIQILKTQ